MGGDYADVPQGPASDKLTDNNKMENGPDSVENKMPPTKDVVGSNEGATGRIEPPDKGTKAI